MPIYEYQCKECGAKFDAFRSFKDADTAIHCKQCHGSQTWRLLSRFNASSGGQSLTSSQNGCSGYSGGSCAGCGH